MIQHEVVKLPPIDIGYWRVLQANRREKERREASIPLRRLNVPPGTYGMRDGEERVVTDSRGTQYVAHATKVAIKSRRGRA